MGWLHWWNENSEISWSWNSIELWMFFMVSLKLKAEIIAQGGSSWISSGWNEQYKRILMKS